MTHPTSNSHGTPDQLTKDGQTPSRQQAIDASADGIGMADDVQHLSAIADAGPIDQQLVSNARALPSHLMHYAEARVPRYTSYPTAPHFTDEVGPETYHEWLGGLTDRQRLSLYLHIPFCNTLCWYCGCNTNITNDPERVSGYADLMVEEIALVYRALNERAQGVGPVSHLHLGGGSPNMLAPNDLISLLRCVQLGFDFEAGAEIACEIDPRDLTDCFVSAIALGGMNRVSLGVQDLNPEI